MSITPDEEFGGNFIDVTFLDLAEPGPAAILFHGTDGSDIHVTSVERHERKVLQAVRHGLLLLNVNGEAVIEESYDDIMLKLQSTARPLTLRMYEAADITVVFEKPEPIGLEFVGQDGRNFAISEIAADSEAAEHRELVRRAA